MEVTIRQKEVWIMLANGMNVKEIALRMGISKKTVESHRENLYRRLGVHSIAELTKLAIKNELVSVSGKQRAGFV